MADNTALTPETLAIVESRLAQSQRAYKLDDPSLPWAIRFYLEDAPRLVAALRAAWAGSRTVWWVCDDNENFWGRNELWATLDQAKAYGIAAFIADDEEAAAEQLTWVRRAAATEDECWDLFRDGLMTDVSIWAVPLAGADACPICAHLLSGHRSNLIPGTETAALRCDVCGPCDGPAGAGQAVS